MLQFYLVSCNVSLRIFLIFNLFLVCVIYSQTEPFTFSWDPKLLAETKAKVLAGIFRLLLQFNLSPFMMSCFSLLFPFKSLSLFSFSNDIKFPVTSFHYNIFVLLLSISSVFFFGSLVLFFLFPYTCHFDLPLLS